MIQRTESARLFEEALKLFPGGVNSPVRAFKSVIGPPLFIKKGQGCYITDEDDNTFIDFCGSWGPLILGHAHPDVTELVIETVKNGTSFGAPERLGNELGQLIIDNISHIDKIRFVSSGTEAVMSALRLARAYTGRTKILKFEGCYHGHVDPLLVKAGSGLITHGESTSAGVPAVFAKETIVVPLNDRAALSSAIEEYGDDLACIIIEPIPANNGLLLQDLGFLKFLRTVCDDHGILLIFDEVISGFRIGFAGASDYYGITPDIVTYGKIIGGGMPVGAYGARNELMSMISPDGPVYQAGTLSANPVAMAAGLATLRILNNPSVYKDLEEKTLMLREKINSHCLKMNHEACAVSIGSIFWISFSKEEITKADQIAHKSMDKFKILHFELLNNGVYLGPSGYEVGFVSTAHSHEVISEAAQKICDALDVVFSKE